MPFDIRNQSDGLKTVANVPLAAVGEDWMASTGPATITEDDLRSAINALNDPAIKTPRIKLGHLDPRFTPDGDKGVFDGTPTLGKFTNLQLGDDGQTIYADAVGVPEWFATIMPYAYPSRSIEGYWNVETSTGHKHDFVISAVALLGDEHPAIETLDDLQTLFSADGPDWAGELVETATTVHVAANKGGWMPRTRSIAASTSVEDIRRSFFSDFATEESGRYWWWIRAVYVEPDIVIATDEEDDLWAVPYTMSDDSVDWGDPVNVFTQYVETGSGKIAASRVMSSPAMATFNKSGGSRPENKEEAMPRTIHASVDVPALRSRLGLSAEQLPDDATDEQINEAVANVSASPDAAVTDNPSAEAPESGTRESGAPQPGEPSEGGAARGALGPEGAEGVQASSGGEPVTVDPEALRQMQEDARMGREARQEQVTARRQGVVESAIRAGKIPPARREHYMTLMSADEEGTTAMLASLAENVVPVEESNGNPGGDEVTTGDAYPSEWLSDGERQRIAATQAGQPQNTRVVSEAH